MSALNGLRWPAAMIVAWVAFIYGLSWAHSQSRVVGDGCSYPPVSLTRPYMLAENPCTDEDDSGDDDGDDDDTEVRFAEKLP